MKSKRVRIRYGKEYPASLIGHLDTIRELLRGMRRAGWGFDFTGGYNPAVKYSSTPALSLGFLSEAEYIDLWLRESLREYKKEIFRNSLASGLEVTEITDLDDRELPINEMVKGFRYKIYGEKSPELLPEDDLKAFSLIERGENYIIVDTLKRNGGIGNPRNKITEGNYSFKKLSCIF